MIITDENLRLESARAFVDNAFRNGAVATTGTAITAVLPPASRFAPDGGHDEKKQRALARLAVFLDRFLGLSSADDR